MTVSEVAVNHQNYTCVNNGTFVVMYVDKNACIPDRMLHATLLHVDDNFYLKSQYLFLVLNKLLPFVNIAHVLYIPIHHYID